MAYRGSNTKITLVSGHCISLIDLLTTCTGQKKNICVYSRTSKKSRVGRDYYFFLFFFLLSAKPEIVGSGIRFLYFVFRNFR
jgi:hypothetical protein